MSLLITDAFLLQGAFCLNAQNADNVYFTSGFKIGEVTNSSAIILTRIFKTPKPVAVYHQKKRRFLELPSILTRQCQFIKRTAL